jgi:hypothetical protein
MSSFRIEVVSDTDEELRQAMSLAFRVHGGKVWQQEATHYVIRAAEVEEPPVHRSSAKRGERIAFFWTAPDSRVADAIALPFKLDAEGAADFARRWLAEVEYPPEPDIDGSVKKGWRLYNEPWGHVEGVYAGICAVTPVWSEYGK